MRSSPVKRLSLNDLCAALDPIDLCARREEKRSRLGMVGVPYPIQHLWSTQQVTAGCPQRAQHRYRSAPCLQCFRQGSHTAAAKAPGHPVPQLRGAKWLFWPLSLLQSDTTGLGGAETPVVPPTADVGMHLGARALTHRRDRERCSVPTLGRQEGPHPHRSGLQRVKALSPHWPLHYQQGF